MSEVKSMSKLVGSNYSPTWIGHLILSSDRTLINKIVSHPDYDSENVHLELTINGVTLRSEDFNKITDQWSDEVEEIVKKKYDFLQSEEAVIAKAEKLIEDKLGNIRQVLDDIESSVWKLKD